MPFSSAAKEPAGAALAAGANTDIAPVGGGAAAAAAAAGANGGLMPPPMPNTPAGAAAPGGCGAKGEVPTAAPAAKMFRRGAPGAGGAGGLGLLAASAAMVEAENPAKGLTLGGGANGWPDARAALRAASTSADALRMAPGRGASSPPLPLPLPSSLPASAASASTADRSFASPRRFIVPVAGVGR